MSNEINKTHLRIIDGFKEVKADTYVLKQKVESASKDVSTINGLYKQRFENLETEVEYMRKSHKQQLFLVYSILFCLVVILALK